MGANLVFKQPTLQLSINGLEATQYGIYTENEKKYWLINWVFLASKSKPLLTNNVTKDMLMNLSKYHFSNT